MLGPTSKKMPPSSVSRSPPPLPRIPLFSKPSLPTTPALNCSPTRSTSWTTPTRTSSILDTDRTRYTHPIPQEIGRQFLGTIEPALNGETFTEIYAGTLGPSVRAVVPIVDESGDVVAIAAAGITVDTVAIALGGRLPIVFAAAGATILIGAFGSWLLSRYLRRVTWGRGPEEMARMFAYYESVLHPCGRACCWSTPTDV